MIRPRFFPFNQYHQPKAELHFRIERGTVILQNGHTKTLEELAAHSQTVVGPLL